ncbi:MAG TPA: response regulator transcription factor [Candidatus Angelobacter sp.]|jgi:two-component system, OmpR family, alkaline phosphatase synthesis response regulator PhoP|nr:response regulator transcription factor [Candidatus Angelobacter sp.]
MTKILVVEDEKHIAQGLRFNLEAEGYSVTLSETGEQAEELLTADNESFDLLLLDVMLPGKDGFSVAQGLRQAQNYIPVLMLTARGRPEDVLKGFESGADDYLPKPFNLDILLARIGGLLRRKRWQQSSSEPPSSQPPSEDQFRFDGKLVDFQRLQLRNGDKTYQLTLMELELLRYLIRNAGRPVSRKEILEQVWNLHEDTDTRAMDNFIVRLRRYIEGDPTKPRHLLTVRGLGYQFVIDPEQQ